MEWVLVSEILKQELLALEERAKCFKQNCSKLSSSVRHRDGPEKTVQQQQS